MKNPFLGQVFITDQYAHFIYVGKDQYFNTINGSVKSLLDFGLPENPDRLHETPANYRIYEAF